MTVLINIPKQIVFIPKGIVTTKIPKETMRFNICVLRFIPVCPKTFNNCTD